MARLRRVADRVAFRGSTAPFLGPVAPGLSRLAALGGDDAEARHWVGRAVATCERAGFRTWLPALWPTRPSCWAGRLTAPTGRRPTTCGPGRPPRQPGARPCCAD
jgi:hypothetical protein